MADMTIKRHDLEPPVRAQLFVPELDGEGNVVLDEKGAPKMIPANLTTATAVYLIIRKEGGTPKLKLGPVAYDDKAKGRVRYAWKTGDTDTSGNYEMEFEIVWPESRPQTIPNEKDDNPVLEIDEDLE
jgi:hypothetical protein